MQLNLKIFPTSLPIKLRCFSIEKQITYISWCNTLIPSRPSRSKEFTELFVIAEKITANFAENQLQKKAMAVKIGSVLGNSGKLMEKSMHATKGVPRNSPEKSMKFQLGWRWFEIQCSTLRQKIMDNIFHGTCFKKIVRKFYRKYSVVEQQTWWCSGQKSQIIKNTFCFT